MRPNRKEKIMDRFDRLLAPFPQAGFMPAPTPLERLDRLSELYDLDLWVKRDDLTRIGFGGNKIRQLDYYFGAALAEGADVALITGAVQSNYVRSAAACAARLGMGAVVQLEDRVPGKGALYHSSGNVLLDRLLGAEILHYPEGEDEAGADRALHARAEELRAEGRKPFVIPLGLENPPKGALGYMQCGREILTQDAAGFDHYVVASGSGATHAGLLAGLRVCGANAPVHGICVRRDAEAQRARIGRLAVLLGELLGEAVFGTADIDIWDGALAPGYGRMGETTRRALDQMARYEGLFLDPVYTAKSFAGVEGLLQEGVIQPGARVCFIHSGGLPALFAYGEDLLA